MAKKGMRTNRADGLNSVPHSEHHHLRKALKKLRVMYEAQGIYCCDDILPDRAGSSYSAYSSKEN